MKWLALMVAVLGGCQYPNSRLDLRIREDVPSGGDGFALALYQSTGAEMLPGNRVELLENSEVFDALEAQIGQAKQSIHMVIALWRPSPPSTQIVRALLAKAREGVACRVVYDPFLSIGFSEIRRALSDGGCDVRQFRPYGPGERARILERNHRRIVVVDGRVGFTGGFGIWRSWEGDGDKPDHWRETSVRIEGPTVRQMQLAFAENWQDAGGPLLGPEEFPNLAPAGPARAAFVSSVRTVLNSRAERLTQVALAAANQRIWIANSYFIPSTAIGDTLVRKAGQGVDIRVLAPGRYHDLPPVRAAQRTTYERLLKNGVRIWEYQLSMMHAKTMLVDDRLVIVGSFNLDPLSLRRNEEAALVVEDLDLARRFELSMQEDLGHSLEVRWDSWRRRGLLERFTRRLTSLFGGIL